MSFLKIWIHLVFSTKNREPFLTKDIRYKVHQHIIENCKEILDWLVELKYDDIDTDKYKELLDNTIKVFKKRHEANKFNYKKLTLKYWVDKINMYKVSPLEKQESESESESSSARNAASESAAAPLFPADDADADEDAITGLNDARDTPRSLAALPPAAALAAGRLLHLQEALQHRLLWTHACYVCWQVCRGHLRQQATGVHYAVHLAMRQLRCQSMQILTHAGRM